MEMLGSGARGTGHTSRDIRNIPYSVESGRLSMENPKYDHDSIRVQKYLESSTKYTSIPGSFSGQIRVISTAN